MSNGAQEMTNPQSRHVPPHRLQGGFLISPHTAFEETSRLENRPDNRGMENHRPAGQPLVVALFGVPGSGFVGRNVIEPVAN